jgi:hypothetical protein
MSESEGYMGLHIYASRISGMVLAGVTCRVPNKEEESKIVVVLKIKNRCIYTNVD